MLMTWPSGSGGLAAGMTFYAPLTTSLVPARAAGSATPTFTRATAATVTDWEGIVRTVLPGEARFQGARRVQNLAMATENLLAGSWTGSSMNVTSGAADPLGGTSAFTLTSTLANGYFGQFLTPHADSAQRQYRVSWWVRRRNGSGLVKFYNPNNSADSGLPVTPNWQRLCGTVGFGGAGFIIMNISLATSGDAIDVWHPQIEEVSGASNQNPGEYLSVGVLTTPYQGANVDGVQYFSTQNGNTVASNVVTAGVGAAIPAATLLGYLAEEQRTNLLRQSEVFGATDWAVSNVSITSNATAAPDGSQNADSLVEDGSTNFHYLAGTSGNIVTKAASALPYALTLFIKPGTRNWAFLQLQSNINNGIRLYFNLSGAGAVGSTTSIGTPFTNVSGGITQLPGGWYRCTLTATSDTDTHIAPFFGGATSDSVGTYVGSNGSTAIIVWGAQLEQAGFATSYLATTTLGATRNLDILNYPLLGNLNNAVGTALVTIFPMVIPSGDTRVIAGQSSTGPILHQAGNPRFYDGTNYNSSSLGLAITANSSQKVGCAWSGSAAKVYYNGVGSTATAFSGTMSVDVSIYVGSEVVVLNGCYKNLYLWQRALADSQLASL